MVFVLVLLRERMDNILDGLFVLWFLIFLVYVVVLGIFRENHHHDGRCFRLEATVRHHYRCHFHLNHASCDWQY